MKALWALEPFHQDNTRIKGMHNLLKQLATNIEVAFIVTRTENDLNLAFNIPLEERYSIYPRYCLKKALKKAKVSINDNKIHVIDFETFSNTMAVKKLLSFAKSRGSDLIGLYTQSRHGLLDFAVGSFAETAIHKSKKDLLLVNPKTKFSPKIKNIFYSMDFENLSLKHLKKVILLCKKTKAKLTIFYAAQVFYKRSLDESNPQILAYREKVEKQKKSIRDLCKKLGVFCEVKISSEFTPTSDLALNASKKSKADLLVVSAKAGPLVALMGGSITRHIVRKGKKPVLVLK